MSEETPVLQVEGLVFGYTGRPVLADWSACIGYGRYPAARGREQRQDDLAALAGQGCCPPRPGGWCCAALHWPMRRIYRRQVFWKTPPDAIDPLTVRDWLQSLPAQHAAWDASALAAHVQGFGLQEHLDKNFTCCPPAVGARC